MDWIMERFPVIWGLMATVATVVFIAGAVRGCRNDEKYGPRICGQVETKTPSGERALVERCWRERQPE